MAGDFTFDISALAHALRMAPDAVDRGVATALVDIKNDWRAESVDAAPIDTSNLRQQIDTKVFDPGASGRVEIQANATRGSQRFNYAYYIHEDAGKAVTGEKKFLDKPAEKNLDKWHGWLEDEISIELRRAGW